MGWVVSGANEWKDYSNSFGEGAGIYRNCIMSHFLAFYFRTVSAPVGI